jgi:hypothetical protein
MGCGVSIASRATYFRNLSDGGLFTLFSCLAPTGALHRMRRRGADSMSASCKRLILCNSATVGRLGADGRKGDILRVVASNPFFLRTFAKI